MAKPLPRRVPSDDCAVDLDGDTYYPHEGEWVEIVGVPSVAELQAFTALAALGQDLAVAEGEPDEAGQAAAAIDRHFTAVCAALAERIVAWNWTDMRGRELPSPDGNPAVFASLSTEELYYLTRVARGERAADRKNDSRPTVTTSSATAQPVMAAARSTTGRNLTRASSR